MNNSNEITIKTDEYYQNDSRKLNTNNFIEGFNNTNDTFKNKCFKNTSKRANKLFLADIKIDSSNTEKIKSVKNVLSNYLLINITD